MRMKRLPEYSQHFLRSPRLVAELIGHSDIKKRDTVYDIGAGSGVISGVLASRAARVVAIEYEPHTAVKLRENMAKFANVTVLEGDGMTVAFQQTPYKVFANIPFHLSSPLVRRLLNLENPPKSAYLIVQKQFAKKLLPDNAGFSSQLGMMIGPWFAVKIKRPLRRTDFWPFPNVDTVLLEIKHRSEPLVPLTRRTEFEAYIEHCFTDPRWFHETTRRIEKPSALKLSDWIELFLNRHER